MEKFLELVFDNEADVAEFVQRIAVLDEDLKVQVINAIGVRPRPRGYRPKPKL